MRTHGTFADVYEAARAYYLGTHEDCADRPMDPVIRRDGSEWMLESGIHPSDGDVEIPLDDFDTYWHGAYTEADYVPTQRDVNAFVRLLVSDIMSDD